MNFRIYSVPDNPLGLRLPENVLGDLRFGFLRRPRRPEKCVDPVDHPAAGSGGEWSPKSFSGRLYAFFLYFLSLLCGPQDGIAGGIELHAHLFMKQGMTWLFNGSFNDPLKAKSWKNRFSSQANPETLIQSNLDIVIVSLYAHPLFTYSMKDSIRKQIELAQQFTVQYPNWILAKTPQDARRALSAGQHVLIFSLEGASGILESETDLNEFVDQKGIRIVNLLHLTDDEFGGTAFLAGIKAFSTPLAFLQNLFFPIRDKERNRINSHGLTEKGREMANSLANHKVWIDLAHSSDTSQHDLLPILDRFQQPKLYTHTVLRKYHHAERGINFEQLTQIAESGGMIGLMPSEEMLENTPGIGSCEGSIHSLATHFKETAEIVGISAIGMGSDFNGGITHLKPSCRTGTRLDHEGFWNIGQSQELWRSLEVLNVYHPIKAGPNSTARFLDAWSRLWAKERTEN